MIDLTARAARRSAAIRLFLTIWIVYAAHATTNVVRETYLAVALATAGTVRVDPYLGLHPDLFEIPGRGAYINSNPGASFLGAVPYLLARPAIAGLFALQPSLGAPKPPTGYDDPRPNRTRLMNEMRARGLDVRLAIAALATQLGLMAPLGALAVVLMYFYLIARFGVPDRTALWLALLYGLGTPLFFRSAFLNQNALLAHVVLSAWLVVTWPATRFAGREAARWAVVGALLGAGLVLDYSAAPLALVFGLWSIASGHREAGWGEGLRRASACAAGALIPIVLLLAYQYSAFGSPWFPAQRYMPATDLSVVGWNGLSLPTVDLMWRNLADPRYGLFIFCPLLLLAFLAPRTFGRTEEGAMRHEAVVALVAAGALWLFSSANQFAHLQWNTGVRYMVPAVPLLFIVAVPVLLRMRPVTRALFVIPTVLISFAVAMTREDVPRAVGMLATEGPVLPILIVLNRTAAAYAPWLGRGIQPFGMLAVASVALLVWLVWRGHRQPSVLQTPATQDPARFTT